MGLMPLAYVFTRIQETEVLFHDVFAGDKNQVAMYDKLGYQQIGQYRDLSLVSVMMLEHGTEYERKSNRMDHFVKPLVSGLKKLIQFSREDEAIFNEAMDKMVQTPAEY